MSGVKKEWTEESDIKVTYYENLTFSMFKCYNLVPVLLPTQKHEKEQPSKYFLVSLSLQACEKMSASDFAPPLMQKEDLIIILPPLKLQVSTNSAAIVFSQATML